MSQRKQKAEMLKHKNNSSGVLLAVIGGVLILLAIVAFIYIPKAQAEVQAQASAGALVPVALNEPAKDVAIRDLDGNAVKFSDYKGKVILYNAWATWCPPCKEEMPVLNAYYLDHKDQGFVVIAVEDGEDISEVAAFVKKSGLAFPVWPDPKWVASDTYGIKNLPTSFVIDKDFNVRYTWTGGVSRAVLEQYVTPLIEQ